MSPPQSEALNDAQTSYVTKQDLDLGLERFKNELQRFMFVTYVAVTVGQILMIKLWH
jgi:hypothetical protein